MSLAHKYVFTYRGKSVRSIKTALTNASTAGVNDFWFHNSKWLAMRREKITHASGVPLDRVEWQKQVVYHGTPPSSSQCTQVLKDDR
jgi:hypothetical protein